VRKIRASGSVVKIRVIFKGNRSPGSKIHLIVGRVQPTTIWRHKPISLREKFRPTGMTGLEELGSPEEDKVSMIGAYFYGERRADKVVSPVFKRINYSQKFLVINSVVEFTVRQGSGVKADGTNNVRGYLSGEDSTKGKVASISFQEKLFLGIRIR
jgi:hypothetical protein